MARATSPWRCGHQRIIGYAAHVLERQESEAPSAERMGIEVQYFMYKGAVDYLRCHSKACINYLYILPSAGIANISFLSGALESQGVDLLACGKDQVSGANLWESKPLRDDATSRNPEWITV